MDILIPHYDSLQHLTVVSGSTGSGSGELRCARCLVVHQDTGHIYVADSRNHRIQVFTQTGQFIQQLSNRYLKRLWGILIHQNNLYVTDNENYAIFLFSLSDFGFIKQFGKFGSKEGEFNYPGQLTMSPDRQIYVTDEFNDRIHILDENLVFKQLLHHPTMSRPVDVKFSTTQMFVLSMGDNPCIHIFTLSGEKSHSLISKGYQKQVGGGLFFCLDARNNIIISDYSAHNIKVFSPEGELLHTIVGYGNVPGMLYLPTGIAILNGNTLVSASESKNYPLITFSP